MKSLTEIKSTHVNFADLREHIFFVVYKLQSLKKFEKHEKSFIIYNFRTRKNEGIAELFTNYKVFERSNNKQLPVQYILTT